MKKTFIHDNKHMRIEDRMIIEEGLNKGYSLTEISKSILKDDRTVSKEIRKHRHKISLEKRRQFNHSNEKECRRLIRFPYVCNGCSRRNICLNDRYYYVSKDAQNEYKDLLSKCRQGLDITKSEFDLLDKTIKDGTNKGQSIYAICQNNPDKIKYTPRNIYLLINQDKLQTKNVDLRAKVKYKPRSKKYNYEKTIKDKEILIGRKIDDYFKFILDNPGIVPVQLDTVEGAKYCKKVLLTLHFVTFHFMMIFTLESQTSEEVTKVFNWINNQIGIDNFKKLFPCILTDRGKEFIDPLSIEFSRDGEFRTKLFYCDAYVSNQKGAIESNHRKLRYIIPKGTNIDVLESKHSLIMMNNIASYPIRELGGKTPYDFMELYFSKDILDKLLIKKVNPTEVNLTSSLLIK